MIFARRTRISGFSISGPCSDPESGLWTGRGTIVDIASFDCRWLLVDKGGISNTGDLGFCAAAAVFAKRACRWDEFSESQTEYSTGYSRVQVWMECTTDPRKTNHAE